MCQGYTTGLISVRLPVSIARNI